MGAELATRSAGRVPGPYDGLEPEAARERPIPRIGWVALIWTLLPGGGIIIGLVLGIIARRRIKASNGQLGGLALANIAIALNLVTLSYFVLVIGPSFWPPTNRGSAARPMAA